MWGNSLPENINGFMAGVNAILGLPVTTVCQIETTWEDCLVGKDKSIGTAMRVAGLLNMAGVDDIAEIAGRISHSLSAVMAEHGVSLQIVFHSDPAGTERHVQHIGDSAVRTARHLMGESAGRVMQDWLSTVSRYCGEENVFLVCWTHPSTMTRSESKAAFAKMARAQARFVGNPQTQATETAMMEVVNIHRGHVALLQDALRNNGILASVMPAHDLMWQIRHQIDAAWTGYDWKARLPGDPLSMTLTEQQLPDLASMYYPSLAKQLLPREAKEWDRRAIQVGDTLFSSMLLELGPQPPVKIFNVLFRSLLEHKMPYRVSFMLHSGGVSGMAMKEILTSILWLTSSVNRRFAKAIRELRDMEESGHPVVTIQASFATWVDMREQSAGVTQAVAAQRSRALLRSRASHLAAAVQGWGGCDVTDVVGDGLCAVAATVPGLRTRHPGNRMVAPLSDVVTMMPLFRPAWPWDQGSFILRTPDGKIMPYQIGSGKQASWIDLGIAPMGGGKSVLLNTYNWAFVTQPGLTRLPWLSILDVGPSSKGLIDMLRVMLPEHQKYLAIYKRLRMVEDDAINPADTALGCRRPLPAHRSFLANFLALLATPLDRVAPYDGVMGLAQAAIDAAYEELSPENHPRLFNATVEPGLVAKAREAGILIDERTSWWEMVDAFFAHDMVHEATLAQRHAMPLLPDFAAAARSPAVSAMYRMNTPSGEELVSFFTRALMEAINAYPLLRLPTRVDLGAAQIISLDLDEVTPRGGVGADRQAGIMYMLARQVAAGHFFLMPADVELMPAEYQSYHEQRISSLRRDPKRLSMDELHRVARNGPLFDQIVADLETSARESRKWNLHIGLYSQSIRDFPDVIINELVTTFFVLGGGSAKANRHVADLLNLPDSLAQQINNLGKPDKRGANMIGVFKTSAGQVAHVLTNTISLRMVWAFSSSTEDVYIRGRLYEQIGVERTLDVLCQMFPGGCKDEVDRRRAATKSSDSALEAEDTLEQLVREVLVAAHRRPAAN